MSSANGAHSATAIESPMAFATEELEASYPDDRAWLVRFFRRRGVPQDEADDLAQETVLRALVHLRRHGRQRADLGPLMRTIARNLLIERVRRSTPVSVSWSDGFDLVDSAPEPEEAVVAAERKAALRHAIRSLTPRHRRVVDLWIGGRTPAEIARELGVKRNAADAILHRARKSLAAKLDGRLAGVVAPALLLRFRARARRMGETLSSLDPSGVIGQTAGGLAVAGTIVAIGVAVGPKATVEPAPALAPAVEVADPSAGRPSSAHVSDGPVEPVPAPAAGEEAPAGEAAVVIDVPNHSGQAELVGFNDSDGNHRSLRVGWELERDSAGHGSVTAKVLDTTAEAACGTLSHICERLANP